MIRRDRSRYRSASIRSIRPPGRCSASRGRSTADRCPIGWRQGRYAWSLSVAIAAARESKRQDRRRDDAAALRPPVVIDRVTPQVSGGPFAAKRIIGRPIAVEADIFADGHDVLAAELLWRAVDEKEWQRAPLAPIGNDRWRGSLSPQRIGRHLFMIEAWRDEYATALPCAGGQASRRRRRGGRDRRRAGRIWFG